MKVSLHVEGLITCSRLVAMAISPHVMSAPNSLQTLRNGRFPTFKRDTSPCNSYTHTHTKCSLLLSELLQQMYRRQRSEKELVSEINLQGPKTDREQNHAASVLETIDSSCSSVVIKTRGVSYILHTSIMIFRTYIHVPVSFRMVLIVSGLHLSLHLQH